MHAYVARRLWQMLPTMAGVILLVFFLFNWVGGDPARGEVYGWAAWMPQGAVLSLRNPADHPQRLTLDLSAALELPRGAPNRFRVTRQHGPAVEGALPLSGVRTFELPAHAVVVWDLTPVH